MNFSRLPLHSLARREVHGNRDYQRGRAVSWNNTDQRPSRNRLPRIPPPCPPFDDISIQVGFNHVPAEGRPGDVVTEIVCGTGMRVPKEARDRDAFWAVAKGIRDAIIEQMLQAIQTHFAQMGYNIPRWSWTMVDDVPYENGLQLGAMIAMVGLPAPHRGAVAFRKMWHLVLDYVSGWPTKLIADEGVKYIRYDANNPPPVSYEGVTERMTAKARMCIGEGLGYGFALDHYDELREWLEDWKQSDERPTDEDEWLAQLMRRRLRVQPDIPAARQWLEEYEQRAPHAQQAPPQ